MLRKRSEAVATTRNTERRRVTNIASKQVGLNEIPTSAYRISLMAGRKPKHQLEAAAHAREAALEARKTRTAQITTSSWTRSHSPSPTPSSAHAAVPDHITPDFSSPVIPPSSPLSEPLSLNMTSTELPADDENSEAADDYALSDAEPDCGYTGGVDNHLPSDWDSDDWSEFESDSGEELSDDELSEIGEEELKGMKEELCRNRPVHIRRSAC